LFSHIRRHTHKYKERLESRVNHKGVCCGTLGKNCQRIMQGQPDEYGFTLIRKNREGERKEGKERREREKKREKEREREREREVTEEWRRVD